MVNLATLIAFWKRKDSQTDPEQERIIPLPQLPEPEVARTTSREEVDRAREALKVLKLEKQIIGSAVATIYESHTKGLISTAERDRLLQKYKVDLAGLEKAIDQNQRIVDLFDLELTREELARNFKAKLAEIDGQIRKLKSGGSPERSDQDHHKSDSDVSKNESSDGDGGEQSAREKKSGNEQEITDAEKRIDKIREEILQAMDRLEQIEAEG